MVELGLYKHYKGKTYNVIGVATHSETLEKLVIYEATYQTAGENLWVRPLQMFTETVIVNNNEVPRFKKIK